MSRLNPPRIRMVILKADGKKDPVPPFNRETQELRQKEAVKFALFHPLNR